jgi:hypothetical protein
MAAPLCSLPTCPIPEGPLLSLERDGKVECADIAASSVLWDGTN